MTTTMTYPRSAPVSGNISAVHCSIESSSSSLLQPQRKSATMRMQLPKLYAVAASWLVLCNYGVSALNRKEQDVDDNYIIGTGIYDMTGPAAQINFMGYGKTGQRGHGIHQRLRSRAFIIAEPPTEAFPEEELVAVSREVEGKERSRLRWQFSSPKETEEAPTPSRVSHIDPEKTICFVSMDVGMGSDLLNTRVLARLDELLPQQANSGKRLCHLENLSISGTHTHSANAGFIQYTLYQITSAGFSEEVMSAYVEGISQSILRAYKNLETGSISVAKDLLFDANINRSPTSYLLNPQSERDEYATLGDTDKEMLQLKFTRSDGEPVGLLNWFPVHGTSMNASNLMLSGDNKGYASYLMEKRINGNTTLPGKGSFVAAFASTNLGDVSPNTAGPRCLDTGLPCDVLTSTCGGNTLLCVASGPGKNMFESTEIIGHKQYDLATSLFDNATETLSGAVSFRHSFVDMSNLTVILESGGVVRTCPAALGYAFAAGTTDGPGAFPFTQGTNTSSPFFNMVGGFLSVPDAAQKKCQHPKPILLNTGRASLPYKWDPASVPISVFRMANLFILNVPCEFTTMAGRRLRQAIRTLLAGKGIENPEITIAGLANSYTHYVTTFEEYAGQRYEGASTLYGPHTLSAYIQELERITNDLLDGNKSESDKAPGDMSKKQISLIPPVAVDMIGWGRKFGSIAIQPKDTYVKGEETVFVSFRSANPRNNQRVEDTFLTVDHLLDDGSWETRYVDGDWSTRFFWKAGVELMGVSFAEIFWEIPSEAPQGIYRICHFGTRKTFLGDVEWLSMHAPDWWVLDAFGSMAVGVLLQAARLGELLSENVRLALSSFGGSHTRDFSGCSRSFLVRS